MATLTLFHGFPDYDWLRAVHDAFTDTDGPTIAGGEARFEGPDGHVVILTGTFVNDFSAGLITGFEVYENATDEGNDDPSAVGAGISVSVTSTAFQDALEAGEVDGDSAPLYSAVVLDGDPSTGYDATGSTDDDIFDATGHGDVGDLDARYDTVGYAWVGRLGIDHIVVSAGEFDNGDPNLADTVIVDLFDGNTLEVTDEWENLEEIKGTQGNDEFNAVRVDNNDWGGSQDINFVGAEGHDTFISNEFADLVVRYDSEIFTHNGPTNEDNAVSVDLEEGSATDTFDYEDFFNFSDGGYVRIHGTDFGDDFTSGGFADGEFRGGGGEDDFFVGGDSNIRFIGGDGVDSFTGAGSGGPRLRVDYDNEKWDHDFDGIWGDDPFADEPGVLVNLSSSSYTVDAATAPSDWAFMDGDSVAVRSAIDTFGNTDDFHNLGEVEIQGTEAQDIIVGGDGPGNFFGHGGDDLLIGGASFNYFQTGTGDNLVLGNFDFDMIDFGWQDFGHIEVELRGSATFGFGEAGVSIQDGALVEIGTVLAEQTELIVGTDGDDTFTSDNGTETADGGSFELTGGAGNDTFNNDEGGGGAVRVNYYQEKWSHPDFDGSHEWGDVSGELGVIVNLQDDEAEADDNFDSDDFGLDIDFDPDIPGFEQIIIGPSSAVDTFQDNDDLLNIHDVRGTGAVDVMYGSDDVDFLSGEKGADFLLGAGGSDYLQGGGGNDTIDGGAGDNDTAVYSGAWKDYTISSGSRVLQDNRVGSIDGTDTVTNVEKFTFSNGTFTELEILNDTPADIGLVGTSVNENAATNTVVGSLSAIDADTLLGDTKAFSIVNADGRFAVSGTNLVVANGALLNRESAPSHIVTIRVTDSHGAARDEQFTITLNDINDNAPAFSSGMSATLAENNAAATVVYDANATDGDGTPANKTITFSLAGTDAARFSIDPVTGEVRFLTSPDFEAPADGGANNAYDIVILASDGLNVTNLGVSIAVTDQPEGQTTSGNDAISGTGSSETFNGGLGNDTLTGKGGADLFFFDSKLNKKTNVDHIADFTVGVDKIQLDKSIFKKLKVGELQAKAFTATKVKPDDRILYNKQSGDLSYDADGQGGRKAIKFATLDGSPDNLSAQDFIVVA